MSASAARIPLGLLILIGSCLAGCRGAAADTEPVSAPTGVSPNPLPAHSHRGPVSSARPTPDPIASKYGFPATIDPAAHHLSHLHGKIVEDQGLRATSPEFGEYEYEAILETLSSYGFVVISEQRPKGADGWEFARRGAKQIAEPSNANVPPGQIAVVGAS